ncbi:MAG: restriction endonuclease [Desulfobacterales bacterium]|nr:restriction endonuclease [Desulfobacterales bacterium]
MALWLVRGGRAGEYENRFLAENRIYITWDGLSPDLSKLNSREDLSDILNEIYPDSKKGTIRNWNSQIWPFVNEMKPGDWVALPRKKKSVIYFGKITGKYEHDPKAEDPYYHSRTVEWFAQDIPRSNFDQDILYSMGAFMTICRISKNDAEARIKAMAANHWKTKSVPLPDNGNTQPDESSSSVDYEQLTRDQIANYIIRKFKGHGMTRLVEAILKAQGYTTFMSPEGPDKGVDILAAPDALGFGCPKICVQVKTTDTPMDRPTLDQLIGTMQNVGADKGLFVSWNGFKSSVDREVPIQFFRVRLWDQAEVINQLLTHYDKLPEEIRAEIPLKRMWALALEGE